MECLEWCLAQHKYSIKLSYYHVALYQSTSFYHVAIFASICVFRHLFEYLMNFIYENE